MPPTMWRPVQLISIPDAAPPYDCETHGAACPVARDTVGGVGSADGAAEPQPRPARPAAATAPGLAGTTAAWPRQFAQVMVEILAGVRPQRQVDLVTTDRVRAQIRHLGPVLAAERRPRIQRVVTSRPTASVVEMTVVVSFGLRSRALAMRLEYVAAREAMPGRLARPARWLCTELETG
ncbi:MAG: Rv3235 family protein [Streptosporangiaceae bacterium]